MGYMKRLMAAVGCAVLLAGCSNDTGDLDAADSPVARYDWDQHSAMEALLEGTLALVDGCLYIEADSSGDGTKTRTVPVFGRGLTSWDNATKTLTYDGVDYELGAFVSAGGGSATPGDSATIPPMCDTGSSGEVFLVQSPDLQPYDPDAN